MNAMHRTGRSLLALLLVVSMLCTMTVAAFADDGASEPVVPTETTPVVTEAEVTEPMAAEPEVTEPEVTEPEVTEPEVTEPEEAQAAEPEETEGTEPEETFTWVHPYSKKVYENLTKAEYDALLADWAVERLELIAKGYILEDGTIIVPYGEVPAAPAEEVTPETEEVLPEAAEEATEPEETTGGYKVQFTGADGNVVEYDGGKDVTIDDILAALGVEIPEGAEIAIDPESIDTDNLIVSEVDGKLVVNSKGAFAAASKNLVVLINGVPTELTVTDDTSAAAYRDTVAAKTGNWTENAPVVINQDQTSGVVEIDFGGKTMDAAVGESEYAFSLENLVTHNVTELIFKNGFLNSTGGGIKIVGEAVVKFVNFTVNAVKEALHIGTAGSTEEIEVTLDKDSSLTTTGKKTITTEVNTVEVNGTKTTLTVDGKVENTANKGYAIDITSADKPTLNLNSHAQISSKSMAIDMSAAAILNSNTVLNGAAFAHELTLVNADLVVDRNYDCEARYEGYSKGVSMPALNTRPGYDFMGYNTLPDGTGKWMTREEALKNNVSKLYCIWVANYSWLVTGWKEVANFTSFWLSTRMSIVDRVATIHFENGFTDAAPCKVLFRDVKQLQDMGAKTVKLVMNEDVILEMELEELVKFAGKDEKGDKINVFLIERELEKKDQVFTFTAVMGKDAGEDKDLFTFDLASYEKTGKDPVILQISDGKVSAKKSK